jgi:hypothetical protein
MNIDQIIEALQELKAKGRDVVYVKTSHSSNRVRKVELNFLGEAVIIPYK